MTTQSAKKRPQGEPEPNPKRSGTRPVADHPHWPAALDQDLIPTQPETEPPPVSAERPPITRREDEEVRDTLPAPPPEHD